MSETTGRISVLTHTWPRSSTLEVHECYRLSLRLPLVDEIEANEGNPVVVLAHGYRACSILAGGTEFEDGVDCRTIRVGRWKDVRVRRLVVRNNIGGVKRGGIVDPNSDERPQSVRSVRLHLHHGWGPQLDTAVCRGVRGLYPEH